MCSMAGQLQLFQSQKKVPAERQKIDLKPLTRLETTLVSKRPAECLLQVRPSPTIATVNPNTLLASRPGVCNGTFTPPRHFIE